MSTHRISYRADDLGRHQHPGLGRVGSDVRHDRVDLCNHELRWHGMDARHSGRVLGGQGGQCAHPVAAEREERLEVGLDAGTSAGIRAGDGQDARDEA